MEIIESLAKTSTKTELFVSKNEHWGCLLKWHDGEYWTQLIAGYSRNYASYDDYKEQIKRILNTYAKTWPDNVPMEIKYYIVNLD